MRGGRRVRYAVSVVVAGSAAAVVLAGCGGGDKEPSASPSSTTASPSGSPTPSAAPVPEPAKQRTGAGAVEFLRFYYAEVGRSQTNPGSVDFGPLSYPGCTSCAEAVKAQERDVTSGAYTKEPAMVIEYTAVRDVPNSGDDTYVDYTVQEKPLPYYVRGQDEPAGTLTAKSATRIAVIRWTKDGWKLRGMTVEPNDTQSTP